jgi:hypothetical protein
LYEPAEPIFVPVIFGSPVEVEVESATVTVPVLSVTL